MKLGFRNSHTKRFYQETVKLMTLYAVVADELGWKLDVMEFSSGLEFDDAGVVLHLCKMSDKQETLDSELVLSLAKVRIL